MRIKNSICKSGTADQVSETIAARRAACLSKIRISKMKINKPIGVINLDDVERKKPGQNFRNCPIEVACKIGHVEGDCGIKEYAR